MTSRQKAWAFQKWVSLIVAIGLYAEKVLDSNVFGPKKGEKSNSRSSTSNVEAGTLISSLAHIKIATVT